MDEFAEITQRKMGAKVEISDVVIIPGHTGICRAKIFNSDERKLVLDQAKTLRHTEYKHIYIRRDLTYAQRGELRLKREAEAAARNSDGTTPALSRDSCDTIPKTVFTYDEMPQATEGSTVSGNAPSLENPEQDPESSQTPGPVPVPHTQSNNQAN